MERTEKQQEIESLKAAWADVVNAYFVDYRGLTVEQVSEFRKKVRETDASYRVVKNRLAAIAARETPLRALEKHFGGMTGVAWNDEDPVSLAKVIHETAKTTSLTFKAGLVDGSPITADELETITSLPTRPELISIFAGMLKQPISKFASLLLAPMRDFAAVLKQVAEKKES